MWFIIAFGVGVVIGGILAAIAIRSKTIGYLRVDTSDPYDEPYLFLELKKNVSNVCAKKYVTFEVKVEDFIPHE
jgi:hypothetical protein